MKRMLWIRNSRWLKTPPVVGCFILFYLINLTTLRGLCFFGSHAFSSLTLLTLAPCLLFPLSFFKIFYLEGRMNVKNWIWVMANNSPTLPAKLFFYISYWKPITPISSFRVHTHAFTLHSQANRDSHYYY